MDHWICEKERLNLKLCNLRMRLKALNSPLKVPHMMTCSITEQSLHVLCPQMFCYKAEGLICCLLFSFNEEKLWIKGLPSQLQGHLSP